MSLDPFTLFGRQIGLTCDTLDVEQFDATFHIEKSLDKTPNKLDLRIYNLNESHRKQLEEKERVRVQLKAGYGDSNKTLPTIYFGDVRTVFSQIDGPDWVTYITSGDGDIVNREKRISQSFSSGTYFRDVINATINKISEDNIDVGNAKKTVANTSTNPGYANQYQFGISVDGPAIDKLNHLLKSCGMEASVQDQKLQILKKGFALQDEAILLSVETGLIGSPEMGVGNKIVRARALLNGDLAPGRKVVIKSVLIPESVYRIERATYIGDVSGNDWYTDIECSTLPAGG